jgi:hypothetical protein
MGSKWPLNCLVGFVDAAVGFVVAAGRPSHRGTSEAAVFVAVVVVAGVAAVE